MQGPDVLRQVRWRLLRQGFRSHYIRKVVGELSDHWNDLKEEQLSQARTNEEAEAIATQRLGTAEELVENISTTMRRTSWWGRHPVLGFGLAPIVSLFLFWGALLYFGSWASGALDWSADSGLAAPNWGALQACILLGRYAGAIMVAALFCLLARRHFCGFKPAFLCCAFLSLHNLLNFVRLVPPDEGARPSLIWGYGVRIPSIDLDVIPCLLPLFVFAFYLALHLRGGSRGIVDN